MGVARSLGDGASPAGDLLAPLLSHERVAHALPRGLRRQAERFAFGLLGLLFPHFATPDQAADAVAGEISALRNLLEHALSSSVAPSEDQAAAVERVFSRLAVIRAGVLLDARAIYEGDPAAHCLDEVIVAYPGFLAIAVHRIAHELYPDAPLFARLLSEVAHSATGIDIHPGARIGASFAIDHGTGIVIGETAVLGEFVRLYQGVTLGAARVNKGLQSVKRHPTIGDHVVIYANATILGGDTVIGHGSRIGGNVWLTRSVPPYSVVMPTARVERRGGDSSPADDLLEFNI
jgi:serine O-acetyltransferase